MFKKLVILSLVLVSIWSLVNIGDVEARAVLLDRPVTANEVLAKMDEIKIKIGQQKKLQNRLRIVESFKKTIDIWQGRLPFGEEYNRMKMSLYLLKETLQYIAFNGSYNWIVLLCHLSTL